MEGEHIASYFVPGSPHPQGSKTPVVRGGRVFLIEGKGKGNQKWKEWRKVLADVTKQYMKENGIEDQYDSIFRVELQFRIRRPSSRPKRVRAVNVRPDLDKLARAVLDGISTQKDDVRLICDDSRVVELSCEKYYAADDSTPGVQIDVYDLEHLRLWPKEAKS